MKQPFLHRADLLIVGGGAAGIAAAITAKKEAPDCRVVILEKKDAPGRKLRATGNGRCNLSNRAAPYAMETTAFFENLGILTRCDDQGRIYPYSESAADTTDLLKACLRDLGVTVICDAAVQSIQRGESGTFRVQTADAAIQASAVLLATGGKAGPQFGCSGDGYTLAKALGHHITPLIPVLTGVHCRDMDPSLKGIRTKGMVRLYYNDDLCFEETGEIQLMDYGLSGICIFNLSRHLKYRDDSRLAPYTIVLDLMPHEDVQSRLCRWQGDAARSQETVRRILCGMLKDNLACFVLSRAGIHPDTPLGDLKRTLLQKLDQQIHSLAFKPTGLAGFKMAQCTAGGIDTAEIDPDTLASKVTAGLYFAGEILDYDGPCGGYNLDHAFHTGCLAARSALHDLQERQKS